MLTGGRPLSPSERADFGSRFGFDFGQVRIHADSEAERQTRAMGARAYTSGHHVVISPRHYSPSTLAGKTLLAHELAHVVQQAGSPPARAHGTSPSEDRFEREARRAAAAAQGQTVHIHERSGAPTLQCDLEGLSYLDRLGVAVVAGLPPLGNGFAVVVTVMMLAVLAIVALVAAINFLFPGVGELVTAALATTGATYILGFLVSLGIAHALTELGTAGHDLLVAIDRAETRADLESAGRTWGDRTGRALGELLPALLAIPQLRAMQTAPLVQGYRPPASTARPPATTPAPPAVEAAPTAPSAARAAARPAAGAQAVAEAEARPATAVAEARAPAAPAAAGAEAPGAARAALLEDLARLNRGETIVVGNPNVAQVGAEGGFYGRISASEEAVVVETIAIQTHTPAGRTFAPVRELFRTLQRAAACARESGGSTIRVIARGVNGNGIEQARRLHERFGVGPFNGGRTPRLGGDVAYDVSVERVLSGAARGRPPATMSAPPL